MQFIRLSVMIIALLHFVPFILAEDVTLLEHGDYIRSVEFSPVNNSLVASAGDDHTIKLWNLRNDTAITLTGHTREINSIAFSPDGRLLASGSNDGTIKLWDVHRQHNIATPEHTLISDEFLLSVAFSPEGQFLASAGHKSVKLWDVDDWTEIAALQHETWVYALVFSPNEQLVASGDGYGIVRVWNVQQRQIIAQLEGDPGHITSIGFTPDGRTLASAGRDGKIKLWSVSNWEIMGTLLHNGTVFSIDFSPDGRTLASAGWQDVNLWSIPSGEKIATLPGHSGWIRGVAFSPNGRNLASGDDSGIVRVQNIESHLESQPGQYTVRLIYFLPSDRAPQPDIDGKLDKLIKHVQQVFANQMNYYGFGRKTFRFETNAAGKAVVHHVKGKFKDEYYSTQVGAVWQEVNERFNRSATIYLVALETGVEVLYGNACGWGGTHGTFGGNVLIPASGECFLQTDVTVHEFGHAFGLTHDFRNNLKPWIDLYSTEPMTTSSCAAKWLDAHRYFNTNQIHFNTPTTLEMLSSGAPGSDGTHLRFKIIDPDGLHQVQLSSKTEYRGAPNFGILDCKSLDGTSKIVEFGRHHLRPDADSVFLKVIDVYGNITPKRFSLDRTPPPQRPETLSIPEPPSTVLAKITGPWLWVIAPTEIGQGGANSIDIDSLARASGGAVTETDVARNDANADERVGSYVWTPGEISPTGLDNINELINRIGLSSDTDIDDHSVYALVTLAAPREQRGVTMKVGSDDAIKVWLNGEVVHKNAINRGAEDFQETFEVRLKQGNNLLLVKVSERGGEWSMFVGIDADVQVIEKNYQTQVGHLDVDVNGDGAVDIRDILLVALNFGETGEKPEDVNGDGIVNAKDIILVANALDEETAASPVLHTQISLEGLTVADVEHLLTQLRHIALTDPAAAPGIGILEQFLRDLLPEETVLSPNYPNPFNPETWIPYQLAEPAEVTLSIYAVDGRLVRTLAVGHQPAGMYQHKDRAAYWDGRNEVGEAVASGVYFYTLTAGDFTATKRMLILR